MSTQSNDRAAGVLLGTACGDALGAGYEGGPPLPDDAPIAMIGRGFFAPGEWTDDTSMAVAVAEAVAKGLDLRTGDGLDHVADGFQRWYADGHKGIGRQTRAVLNASGTGGSAAMTAAAAEYAARLPHESAGNGALMRTAGLALAYLDDPSGLVAAAKAISDLTHGDAVSGEACALWSLGIRHAVLYATFDGVRDGLAYLSADRSDYWRRMLDEAEAEPPSAFANNGWVVQALQGAWSAIVRTQVPADDPGSGSFPAQHLRLALEAAVRGGRDTDTVAAIAGGLLGSRWGASAVPAMWRREVQRVARLPRPRSDSAGRARGASFSRETGRRQRGLAFGRPDRLRTLAPVRTCGPAPARFRGAARLRTRPAQSARQCGRGGQPVPTRYVRDTGRCAAARPRGDVARGRRHGGEPAPVVRHRRRGPGGRRAPRRGEDRASTLRRRQIPYPNSRGALLRTSESDGSCGRAQ